MGVRKSSPSYNRRPATTPEAREHELVNLAEKLAEKQLREGTASAQVISHYLKLGSTRERLEQERLAEENGLLRAKRDDLESRKRVESLYEEALNAMRAYSGQAPTRSVDDYED
jgi:hypothetical protein